MGAVVPPPPPPRSAVARPKAQKADEQNDSASDATTSLLVGMAADNAIVGGMLGGDPLAAVVGDLLNDGELF